MENSPWFQIVRRCSTLAISIWLTVLSQFGVFAAERWSRQVSNSEWIPLADPRMSQVSQTSSGGGLISGGGSHLSQVQSLALPPALQQQYQEQLLQLQKTQESIQKLLLLQQQLKIQQQLLQSQTFLPTGFNNPEDDKQGAHHGSTISNLPSISELAPEVLVPPVPSTEALPPVFPPQNFLPHRHSQPLKTSGNQDLSELTGQDQSFKGGQGLLHHDPSAGSLANIEDIRDGQQHGPKRPKGSLNQDILIPHTSPIPENVDDEEEEVQLVYVPAETLAQRGQPKRGRGRKQYPLRQQQQHQQHQQQFQQLQQHQQQQHHHHHHPHQQQQQQQTQQHHQQHHQQQQQRESSTILEESTTTSDQDTFARQLLQQIQKEREEKAQFFKEERIKEISRLNEEQRALERKARLQQEALQREQELQRQRDAERKRKELERLEEMAKRRELERIREAREKQRQEELERRRLAEIRAKEERRREEEAARQKELERRKEQEAQQAGPKSGESLPLQQPTRQSKGKLRGRQRQRLPPEPPNYPPTTTPPSPNQPPLSVYMGNPNQRLTNVKISDVLRILKDAKTIAVLDTVVPQMPRVFVGPTSLEPPEGYAKFDLPYLSSIDHNRVERKVDKLPFFVAPLSFDPPPGYSKIPFPAPHIGSVVVNTLDSTEQLVDEHNPSPTPLIEPNSYSDGNEDRGLGMTTTSYESSSAMTYVEEAPGTPKYEQGTYSTQSGPTGPGGSRFRFRQYYGDGKPASVVGTSYYEDQRGRTKQRPYYDEARATTQSSVQTAKVETSVARSEDVSYSSTPGFRDVPNASDDSSTKEQDLAAQLALINQELAQQREAQRYDAVDQRYQHRAQTSAPTSQTLSGSYDAEASLGDINDVRSPIGPTQYSFPSELPEISPHLPGLVNSLIDKHEANLRASTAATATTTTTTTTTTTERPSSTTYRPRGRQRVRTSARPRTTTSVPSTRSNADRARRPYNRSRSRYSTTTEEYRDTGYEPTKAKIPETTLKYNTIDHRRPSSRNSKYRSRDKTNLQGESLGLSNSVQAQQATGYDNVSQVESGASIGISEPSGPAASSRDQDALPPHSSLNEYPQENYPPTTLGTTENYPAISPTHVALAEDYSGNQNYPQNRAQEARYQASFDPAYEQVGLEKTPVNGFNYRAQSGEPKEYKLEEFDATTTMDPRSRATEEHGYSPLYEVNVPGNQPEYQLETQENYPVLESRKVVGNEPIERPIFLPLPQAKEEDYEVQISSTNPPLTEATTQPTTTSTGGAVIIRQRVRGRLGGRGHQDSAIQTRPRGSQDEYVRFSAVNQDGGRSSSNQRHRSRPRTRVHSSQIQTEGDDYIKIHAARQQRPVATSLPTTTSTSTTPRAVEEDVDYGFIRPPNFKPVHPVENRYPAPITYRPAFSEVPSQSILANDETAVEANPSQTQVVKNRQKYHQVPNRRLSTKLTTLPPATTTIEQPTTMTTTEEVPVATSKSEDTVYTVRPKTRPEEPKVTRIRGRIRRPGKKRVTTTTSTTESVLEAHNELPLDENYPRITQPLPTVIQQPLYEENFEGSSQFAPVRDRPEQYYDATSENYPSQEFVLNFGILGQQAPPHEEYDQTQLASDPPRKYSHSSRTRPHVDGHRSSTADIYGSESQWSTKLTRTSFQPSFASNRVQGSLEKDREWSRRENEPEIITVAPDAQSATVVVSSEDEKLEEESLLMRTTVFGRRTNPQEQADKANATTPTPTTSSSTHDYDSWMMDSVESPTEQRGPVDFAKTTKKTADPAVVTKGTRRKRVRVRVRPVMDDFVTAESQHFNSAVNSLVYDRYKYDPVRESKLTTAEPSTTSIPRNSALQDFLDEMMKNDDVSVPVRATSTSTEVPADAWTTSTPITTPFVPVEDDQEVDTTIMPAKTEKKTPAQALDNAATSTTALDAPYDHQETAKHLQESLLEEQTFGNKKVIDGRRKESKPREERRFSKKDHKDDNNLAEIERLRSSTGKYERRREKEEGQQENGNEVSLDYTLKRGRVEGESVERTDAKDEPDQRGSTGKQDEPYPKNHRAKWSEVRYPSAFEHSRMSGWNYEPANSRATTSIPGVVTKKEGESSVRALTDYVKAIFDSMKSAEEENRTRKEEEDGQTVITTTSMETVPGTTNVESMKLTGPEEDKIDATTVNYPEDGTTINQEVESTTPSSELETATTMEDFTTILMTDATTIPPSSSEASSRDPATTTTTTTTTTTSTSSIAPRNSTESILGKVLRTSTTTKVSHMTEICYRGRCVMTRPKRDERSR
ncbi:hypothetical protein KM043_017505 [Ampulex compressa]|nr:hypothetical protein KM043_017505 [Ampulex compressa]